MNDMQTVINGHVNEPLHHHTISMTSIWGKDLYFGTGQSPSDGTPDLTHRKSITTSLPVSFGIENGSNRAAASIGCAPSKPTNRSESDPAAANITRALWFKSRQNNTLSTSFLQDRKSLTRAAASIDCAPLNDKQVRIRPGCRHHKSAMIHT
ncbi:hypothetical protein IFR05_003487 [Cadophora sp. M221]|nr:hypothetical protein IFR05_003487 [Cadophora sp. M221]